MQAGNEVSGAVRKMAAPCTQRRTISKLWKEWGVGYVTTCTKAERKEGREVKGRKSLCVRMYASAHGMHRASLGRQHCPPPGADQVAGGGGV